MCVARPRPAAVTLHLCGEASRGHTFPVPSPNDDVEAQWAQLLRRAAEKLHFDASCVASIEALGAHETDACGLRAVHQDLQKECDCGNYAVCGGEAWRSMRRLPPLTLDGVRHLAFLLHTRRLAASPAVPAAGNAGCSSLAYLADADENPVACGAGSSGYSATAPRASAIRSCKRRSPKELRDHANRLWAALDSRGVFVPPLPEEMPDEAEKKKDKYLLERHGHGRGNTKSTKKRRSKESVLLLEALVTHLEQLVAEHAVELPEMPTAKEHRRRNGGGVGGHAGLVLPDACGDDVSSSQDADDGEESFLEDVGLTQSLTRQAL
eukprot:TRINITY_DN65188_c0_g1_i1.p1 TRINITY_DN65188_c0_g1~~TRINITY_DN65188_c0_g1_i1.p1  ORF type:complete len:323 (+),score=57.34 TRINITY_DN65188_c0_g1_i1:67-1035(+)